MAKGTAVATSRFPDNDPTAIANYFGHRKSFGFQRRPQAWGHQRPSDRGCVPDTFKGFQVGNKLLRFLFYTKTQLVPIGDQGGRAFKVELKTLIVSINTKEWRIVRNLGGDGAHNIVC